MITASDLREKRKILGLTQKEIAKCVCVTEQTIIAWESGHHGLNKTKNQVRLTAFFKDPLGETTKNSIIGKPKLTTEEYNIHIHERSKKYYEYTKKRRATDPQFRLSRNLRSRLCAAIHSHAKAGSAVRDLGCSIQEFMVYITNLFSLGMSWENWGNWHLDHIIPLASFDLSNREQLLVACHYSNMQPLWAMDNFKKGSKI